MPDEIWRPQSASDRFGALSLDGYSKHLRERPKTALGIGKGNRILEPIEKLRTLQQRIEQLRAKQDRLDRMRSPAPDRWNIRNPRPPLTEEEQKWIAADIIQKEAALRASFERARRGKLQQIEGASASKPGAVVSMPS
eukprot:CAMPEP_0172637976 /NCGR_PEP_ID=MMETSP1068-20121228/211731_1 /TAXON_ID=35684 /ORGANISM="Pseudopedinella elastica, Strain CCMP716" /LENGTH=137 /DNA_ID=CAMNT_0013450775 /DNA_START=65 /DNA_END=475 /DNA_ORIENTATION=+